MNRIINAMKKVYDGYDYDSDETCLKAILNTALAEAEKEARQSMPHATSTDGLVLMHMRRATLRK